MIRTRADSLTDAWANDTTNRDAALASGAQVISTDYPVPEILNNGYFAAIPGGTPSGCNPIATIGIECAPETSRIRPRWCRNRDRSRWRALRSQRWRCSTVRRTQ